MKPIRIPSHRQGQTGTGQGGWTAQRFVAAVGQPATVAIRSPIPIDVDLEIVAAEAGRWVLVDPRAPDVVILEATRWEPEYSATTAVSIDDASDASARFPLTEDSHPAPRCFSCGLDGDTMGVHSGSLGDGRWATDWRVPMWAVGSDGDVDEAIVWSAIDCASGWYAQLDGLPKHAVTVQLAVDLREPLRADAEYSLVSWCGDYSPDWDGRKRGAAAELFDSSGTSVARSRSFWVALPD